MQRKVVTTVTAAEAETKDSCFQSAGRMDDSDQEPVCDDSLVPIDFGSRVLTGEKKAERHGNHDGHMVG